MTLALLIAGIFAVVAGLLAILFGYANRDFSVGSTLIISGTIAVCSGMLLAGLYTVVMELKASPAGWPDPPRRPRCGSGRCCRASGCPMRPSRRPPWRIEPSAPPQPPAAGPPPWQGEVTARERPRVEAPPEPEAPTPPAAAEPPRRRNLMFASTSRKERERAESKAPDGSPTPP